jgi:sulfonate transport system substrate-binding protein
MNDPRHFSRRRVLGAAAALAGAAALPASPAFAAESRSVRIGFQKGGLLLLSKTRGALDRKLAALGWSIHWIEFPAGPQLLEGLNVNAIDFGVTGSPPPIFAQAAGVDFVYVGAEPGQPTSAGILVPADSPARKVADLKGKRVALQKGSDSHYLLIALLRQAGLRYDEIQPVFLTPADARAAFQTGSIDAWAIWDPYLTIAQDATHARVIADYTGVGAPWSFYEAQRGFATANPELVRAIVAQLADDGAWANAHVKEMVAVLAPLTGLPADTLTRIQTRVRFGAVPVTPAILASQQKVADVFFEQKVIPKAVDVSRAAWR